MSDLASHVESYWGIVWRQFRRNGSAYYSLWGLLGLTLIAIFAPLLASAQPLTFVEEDGSRLFPWFRDLFVWSDQRTIVDLYFNALLVSFFPWWILVWGYVSLPAGRVGKGPGRTGLAVVGYLAVAALVTLIVVHPRFAPDDRYKQRSFAEEEFALRNPDSPENRGAYVIIPHSESAPDLTVCLKPPGYKKRDYIEKIDQDGGATRVENPERRTVNDGRIHWLGTADNGQDVLAQMIYGSRIALTVGIVAVAIYVSIGVVLGAIAGYFGGWIDMLLSRIMEVVMVFPSFFLILTLVGLMRPNIYLIMGVIGLVSWPSIARLVRGEVLKQRSIEYTLAARALGATPLRVLFRHVLPNSLSPVLVTIPFGIAGAVVTEAGLALLGVGVPAPAPTWGRLLQIGQNDYGNWWLIVVPSAAIFVTVSLFNLVGSGLRDAMDPRLRR